VFASGAGVVGGPHQFVFVAATARAQWCAGDEGDDRSAVSAATQCTRKAPDQVGTTGWCLCTDPDRGLLRTVVRTRNPFCSCVSEQKASSPIRGLDLRAEERPSASYYELPRTSFGKLHASGGDEVIVTGASERPTRNEDRHWWDRK
jgi:hypothetical protein